MPDVWDLVVVGGGPAGSAAALRARQLRPDARVLIVDRADFPRDKPCGDGVAPHPLDVLADLGVSTADIVDGFRPVQRLRLTSPTGYVAARSMRRQVRDPRAVLDARLLDAAREARNTCAGTASAPCSAQVTLSYSTAPFEPGRSSARTARSRAFDVCSACRPTVAGTSPSRCAATRPSTRMFRRAGHHHDRRALAGVRMELSDRRRPRPTLVMAKCCAVPVRRTRLLQRLGELLPGVEPAPETLRAHRLPLSSSRPKVVDGPVILAGDALS